MLDKVERPLRFIQSAFDFCCENSGFSGVLGKRSEIIGFGCHYASIISLGLYFPIVTPRKLDAVRIVCLL